MQRRKPTMPAAALAGAVDLSSLKRPAPAGGNGASGDGAQGSTAGTVIDVTEATFPTEVIERSRTVPVILDFWAGWCGPCKQFSPVMEKLAVEGAGAWVLARIDVDANQRLAAAAGVQGIPAVKAVVDGQIVAEFSGAIPEANLRQWITALLDVVAQAKDETEGLSDADDNSADNSADDSAANSADQAADQVDSRVVEAEHALHRGDMGAAQASYRAVLADRPGDLLAVSGLAQVALIRRVSDVADPEAALAAARSAPQDLPAQLLAADVEFLSGLSADPFARDHPGAGPAVDLVEAAFARLVSLVSASAGDDREAARTRLLSLFEVLPPDDPRVGAARRKLMAALF